MFKTRLLATCTWAILCAACATAPPVEDRRPRLSGQAGRLSSTDLADFHQALDESYASIVARESKPVIANVPAVIFQYAMSPYDEWHALAWAGALVLTIFVLGVNLVVRFFVRRGSK